MTAEAEEDAEELTLVAVETVAQKLRAGLLFRTSCIG